MSAPPPSALLAELSAKGVEESLAQRVKTLMTRLMLAEQVFTGRGAAKYVSKALRTGAWRSLSPLSKALLLAVRRWKGRVKSPVLKHVLARIYVEIDLYTTRGKAIFHGIIEAMAKAQSLLKNPVENLSKIITLGIQYINLPLTHRIHG